MKIQSWRGLSVDSVKTMCLGPSCQCDSILHEATARWDAHIGGHADAGRVDGTPINTTMVQTRWRPVPVRLPSWVGRHSSGMSPAGACGCTRGAPCSSFCTGLLDTPARYTLRSRQLNIPGGLDITSRFRHAWTDINASVCQVSFNKYAMHDDIDAGLVEAGRLAVAMGTELHAILGKVGMNDSMSALVRNAATCWDWADLAFRRPVPEEVHAFRATCALLRPCLQHTYYPIGNDFARVVREWPSDADLCRQYMCLAGRVRAATQAAQRGHATATHIPKEVVDDAQTWTLPPNYELRPLWVDSLTFLAVKAAVALTSCGLSHSATCKIASIVSGLLKAVPSDFNSRFCAAGSRLGMPGQRRKLRTKKQPEFTAADFKVGDVAVQSGSQRRLVIVEGLQRGFAGASRVTASIVRHKWFSVGDGVERSRLAWHAARMAHRWPAS